MKRKLIIILSTIIAIPFLVIACYIIYSMSVKAYAVHLLRKAAPDAEYYDYQNYEYGEGHVHSYEVYFYRFNEFNPEYTKTWEEICTGGSICKVRRINAPMFPDVIFINPEKGRASIEFHMKY